MGAFEYKAINRAGEIVLGAFEANSKEDAMTKLNEMQFTPLSVTKKKASKKLKLASQPRIKKRAVLMFTKQLNSLLKAGVPLLEAIQSLQEQEADENFIKVLEAISNDISAGNSFSKSLRKFPKIFSELYINTVHIGEVSGTLDSILINLANYIEDEMKLSKNLTKATRYPIMVFIALIGAFVVFITFVIPKFTPIFERSGMELPMPTKMILFINYIFSNYWLPLIGAIGLIIFAFYNINRTKRGKYIIHKYALKAPIYGALLQKISIQRFSSTMAILSRAGIPLIQAMDIAYKIETNAVYKLEINKLKDLIEKGQTIAGAMRNCTYFPPIMIHMISIGEKSGSLDEMLQNVAEFNDSEIENSVDNLTAAIEPIVTVVLGVMVLFLALSIFLPMWNMMDMVK